MKKIREIYKLTNLTDGEYTEINSPNILNERAIGLLFDGKAIKIERVIEEVEEQPESDRPNI